MDQRQRPQQNRPVGGGGGGGGSVRRAREMAESQQRGMEVPRNAVSAAALNRVRPPMPVALASKTSQIPVGVTISRPIQSPQWPLAGSIETAPDPRGTPQYQQYQPPVNRGPPPKRPPRPSQVPQMPGGQDYRYVPPARYEQETAEEPFSPEIMSPMTSSSRPSTISSVGSIPDFPAPAPSQVGPGRRSANLGPPPSSRRGASSYYSQPPFVSPIPEESPRHQSYASSAAMPTSWGTESPRDDVYDEREYEDEEIQDHSRYQNGTIEEVRGDSRESNGDDSDDRGLIRSASFGRRAKPSMITTRSSDRIDPARPGVKPQQNTSKLAGMGFGGAVAEGMRSVPAQRETAWPGAGNEDPLASGTGLIDSSSSSSESVPTVAQALSINGPSPLYTPQPSDPTTNTMLGAYNRASALYPPPPTQPAPNTGFSRLSAIKRPPRLNMDAVRDAEARGSLTSLPDLIARATRLAAMMDRGKRPGSRMALDDFSSEKDYVRETDMGNSPEEKHKSGLSGMLAAFPPPGATDANTPTRPMSAWPTGYGPSDGTSAGKQKKKGRRCCGLSCWVFMLIFFILLVAAAAAVVVPLEFFVFHKNAGSSTPSLSVLQQCEASSTKSCQNGGTSILDNGNCACICTNGFTGSTCTSANATGCTTTTITSVNGSVTLGDAITRLIDGAQANFSVPLDATTIIARFNSNSLSCATENALVTLDGRSGRVGAANDVVKAKDVAAATPSTPAKLRRIRGADVATASATVTSAPSTTTQSPAAAESSAALNPTGTFVITEEVLDFGRVAILYILQQSTLDSAVNAQTTLQKFFSVESFTNQAAMNVSLGNGAWADLVGLKVGAGSGTVGGSSNGTVTKRMVGSRIMRRQQERSVQLLDAM